MSAVRYLLDENVDPLYRRELLRREPTLTIWRVADISVPPEGTLDPDILLWCEEHVFMLVTNNRKSMPSHLQDHLAQGRHIPGVIVMNDKLSVGETVEQLYLIWAALTANEYLDRIVYLPLR